MQPEQLDKAYLWDMLDAAEAIREFIHGKTPDNYATDRMLRGAVERHIEIIGEAARRVSDGLKAAHPEIPWRSLVGQRNILAHEYGEVRHELIWNVAMVGIPKLVAAVRAILPDEADDD
jgi:uncharacterized protein with HEPN domain